MLILSKKNVWDASIERLHWLFDEFPEITVQHSGGKDSTIIFNLALQVARERNRLPLRVLFVDQEAEWTQTIEHMREVMSHPDVEPHWYQVPIKIENATSYEENYLHCWEEGKEWLREKEDISIKENNYGVDGWEGIFQGILKEDFPYEKHCTLAGVRAEESPRRRVGMTQDLTYKNVTWGNRKYQSMFKEANHYCFYPIYDWSYTDVWKAIHDNQWSYCEIYDLQYNYGVSIRNMRVSNLHHETAVQSLFYLQEIDGDLYNRLSKRLGGIDTAGKMNDDFFVKELPFMFCDWEEYCLHLMDKLVESDSWKKSINTFLKKNADVYDDDPKMYQKACKAGCNSILANDTARTKLRNFDATNTGIRKKEKRIAKENAE